MDPSSKKLKYLGLTLASTSGGRTLPIVKKDGKIRLRELVSISSLRYLEFDHFTFVTLEFDENHRKLTNIESLLFVSKPPSRLYDYERKVDFTKIIFLGLTNLRAFSCASHPIRNVDLLSHLTVLEKLSLPNIHFISDEDLASLTCLTNLTALQLFGWPSISQLPIITAMTQLIDLEFKIAPPQYYFEPDCVDNDSWQLFSSLSFLETLRLPMPYNPENHHTPQGFVQIPWNNEQKDALIAKLRAIIGSPNLKIMFYEPPPAVKTTSLIDYIFVNEELHFLWDNNLFLLFQDQRTSINIFA